MLMKDPNKEELDERYVGKRKLFSMPSLNSLARIQAKYEGNEGYSAE